MEYVVPLTVQVPVLVKVENNSGPSTNPLLKSNCKPTGCSTAVTDVVPVLS